MTTIPLLTDHIPMTADFKDSVTTIPFTYSMTTNSLIAAELPAGRDYRSMAR